MFGTSLQLAGAIMLGYLISLRKSKDAISSSHTILYSGKKLLKVKEKLIETQGYRIGFIYIILGYLLPIFEGDYSINKIEKLFIICFVSTLLALIGHYLSHLIGDRVYENLRDEDFDTHASEGTIKIVITDEDSKIKDIE